MQNKGEKFGQRLSRELFAHERQYKAQIFLESGHFGKEFCVFLSKQNDY